MIYDVIILGAGPAGITAAIYAARKQMQTLVISQDIGGQTNWSAEVENYTGYQVVTGLELVEKFTEHLNQFDIQINEFEKVLSVEKTAEIIEVQTEKGKYKSRTLIIATGRVPRKLQVPGEDEFLRKGVAYCSTCDGPMFAGKEVAVIGGGNSALDAVLQMINIASKVYLIDVSDEFIADPVMLSKAQLSEKVEIYQNTEVKEILGDKFVESIKVNAAGEEKQIEVSGIFIEIGSIPSAEYISDISKNKTGEIIINCQSQTSIPAVFAAGDVTDVYAKQIVVACGEGAKAALASFSYINKLEL